MKRYISLILTVFLLLSSTYTPSFAADSPQISQYIFQDNFDDGEIDEAKAVFSSSNNTGNSANNAIFEETGGKLSLRRPDQTNQCNAQFRYYFNDEHTSYSEGLYCIEYKINKSNNRQVYMRIMSGNSEYSRDLWQYGNIFKEQSLPFGTEYTVKYFLDPAKSLYYVWVNDVLFASECSTWTAGVKSFDSIQISLEGGNAGNCTVTIDDLKLYKTDYTDKMKVDMASSAMTVSSLLTAPENILGANFITTNLNLYKESENGCTVSWTSTDNDVINPETGAITRSDSDKTVTVTAEIIKGESTVKKSFEFTVLAYSEDYMTAQKDAGLITPEQMTSQAPDELTQALSFIDTGAYGSKISYTSDNTDVITGSGRVIRPLAGKSDETITVTAHITCGAETISKAFTFTVKAQETLNDPMIISDEDFFGVYDKQSGEWTNKGKFDYDYVNPTAELGEVKEAVMAGDYDLAKEELLAYIRARKPQYSKSYTRDTIMANAAVSGLVYKSTLLGEAFVGDEWKSVEADIPVSSLSAEIPLSLDIVAFYDEASMAEIMSKESDSAPVLRLTVNGSVKDFKPTDDGYVRIGSYMSENYSSSDRLYVKMFGGDLSDETYRTMMKFDISSLGSTSGITSAKLVFKAKASLSSNEKKRLLIIKSYSTLWDEETLNYKSVLNDYRSFNGQPNGIDWVTFTNADVEYMYQICRFGWLPQMMYEYEYSGDEAYAYSAIREMMDFIIDYGAWKPSGAPQARGQYPRTLDTQGRLANFIWVFDGLCRSESMTSDNCTAILKHIWDMCNATYNNHSTTGNWAQSEMMYLYRAGYAFPEFAASNGTAGSEVNWVDYAHKFSLSLMEVNYYDDGCYIEPTGGYSIGSHSAYIATYGEMKEHGYTISDEAYQKLHDGTYYNLLSYAPGGILLLYGDGGYGVSPGRIFAASDEIFEDENLQYIDTSGSLGTKPSWTSRHFPTGKYTFMRSDWSDMALYMATQVRGYEYGSHGHADRNHVSVAAYGKLLLTDAGSFTYTAGDFRELGRSTKMHNTVSINDAVQTYNKSSSPEDIEEYGTVNTWHTDSAHDFLSQSTTATDGFNHTRTIMFVKPYYWIVSDYIDPDNDSAENDIKQNWHMMPTAGMTVDAETNTMYSNNDDNINIVVASADADAAACEEDDGYWAVRIGTVTDNPYGYFQKTSTGDTTFDTVLFPTNTPNSSVITERLDTGVDTSVATAVKITTNVENSVSNGYYYLSYEDKADTARSFGKYSADGRMAFVHEDADGNADMMIMREASVIKANGETLLKSNRVLSDVSVSVSGSRMNIETSEDIALSDLKIYSAFPVKSVYINGEKTTFTTDGSYITYDKSADSNVSSVSSLGGSWSVGGSAASAGTVVLPSRDDDISVPSDAAVSFEDVGGHWAEAYISSLHSDGIINGKSTQFFAPDDIITRSEFLALIVRMFNMPRYTGSLPFEDVSADDWFYDTVSAALQCGIISYDTAFRPNDTISREEMAAILQRAYHYKFPYVNADDIDLSFADADTISQWAAASVRLAVKQGLMQGVSDSEFSPHTGATRAQAAAVIYRFRNI